MAGMTHGVLYHPKCPKSMLRLLSTGDVASVPMYTYWGSRARGISSNAWALLGLYSTHLSEDGPPDMS